MSPEVYWPLRFRRSSRPYRRTFSFSRSLSSAWRSALSLLDLSATGTGGASPIRSIFWCSASHLSRQPSHRTWRNSLSADSSRAWGSGPRSLWAIPHWRSLSHRPRAVDGLHSWRFSLCAVFPSLPFSATWSFQRGAGVRCSSSPVWDPWSSGICARICRNRLAGLKHRVAMLKRKRCCKGLNRTSPRLPVPC